MTGGASGVTMEPMDEHTAPGAEGPAEEPAEEPATAAPRGADRPDPAPPLVRWDAPAADGGAAASDAPVGVVPRLVAYLIDGLVTGLLPSVPLLFVVTGWIQTYDWSTFDPKDPAATAAFASSIAPLEPYFIGAGLFGVALSFVYFVGLWTSRSGATLGMRVVRFRVVDAAGGGTLGLTQAVRRWAALGLPLSLLSFVPVAAISQLGGLQPLWALVLLISTAADARRRGLHDQFAATRMERPEGKSQRTALGCAVLIVVYVAAVLAVAVVVGAAISQVIRR